MTREEAINNVRSFIDQLTEDCQQSIRVLVPELAESEDESLKNKSGYYKGGKFWKASTLWQAVKNKIPQRVPNRYILQDCTWNISSLRAFADEVKNVQEAELDYPIILDINGNILDGAHRVVKAYLQNKDIDVVYLGDDEWPEPDYDEEKAVKESDNERIRKAIIDALLSHSNSINILSANGYSMDDVEDYFEKLDYFEKQKEQQTEEWSEEDKKKLKTVISLMRASSAVDPFYDKMYLEGWLKSLPERFNLQSNKDWSEEDKKILDELLDHCNTENATWYNFLKSLRPPFKDREMKLKILKYLSTRCSVLEFEEVEDYLNELLPSWRPSAKQMEALNAINCHGALSYVGQQGHLISLYNDIKKL